MNLVCSVTPYMGMYWCAHKWSPEPCCCESLGRERDRESKGKIRRARRDHPDDRRAESHQSVGWGENTDHPPAANIHRTEMGNLVRSPNQIFGEPDCFPSIWHLLSTLICIWASKLCKSVLNLKHCNFGLNFNKAACISKMIHHYSGYTTGLIALCYNIDVL